MCIIIAKPRGASLPPISHIENSFRSNPHGFACLWENKGKIKSYKTLDKAACLAFYTNLLREKQRWHDVPFSFHFRFATNGSKTESNCHAYIDETKKIGFQHNGILSYVVPKEMDITDSEYFFRNIFLPVFKTFGMEEHIIENFTEGGVNKFSFIYNGTIYLFGNFIEESGCYYSNNTYQDYEYNYGYTKSKIKNKSPYGSIGLDLDISYDKTPIEEYDDKFPSLPCDTCADFDCKNCKLWNTM